MTEVPHDKEIDETMRQSGSIMMMYNSLNYEISVYIVNCTKGTQDNKEIHKVLNRGGKKGGHPYRPYRFVHFVNWAKKNGKLSLPENELLESLDTIRNIRNSIGHWIPSKTGDGKWEICDTKNSLCVNVKKTFEDFMSCYNKVNNVLLKAMQ